MDPSSPGERFPRSSRVRRRREYLEIYEKGAKLVTPFFVAYCHPGPGPGLRLGLTVSRKVGNAVIRNRVKRLFRELFRRNRPTWDHPTDLVLGARKTAATASYRELEEVFLKALAALERLSSPSSTPVTDPSDGTTS